MEFQDGRVAAELVSNARWFRLTLDVSADDDGNLLIGLDYKLKGQIEGALAIPTLNALTRGMRDITE